MKVKNRTLQNRGERGDFLKVIIYEISPAPLSKLIIPHKYRWTREKIGNCGKIPP